MTKEWKGSAKPSFKIRPMELNPPEWVIWFSWFGLAVNIASFIMNAIAGSIFWTLLALVSGLWLAYYLWSFYQTRKA